MLEYKHFLLLVVSYALYVYSVVVYSTSAAPTTWLFVCCKWLYNNLINSTPRLLLQLLPTNDRYSNPPPPTLLSPPHDPPIPPLPTLPPPPPPLLSPPHDPPIPPLPTLPLPTLPPPPSFPAIPPPPPTSIIGVNFILILLTGQPVLHYKTNILFDCSCCKSAVR